MGVWVARYLGPANYGTLSYVMSLVSFVTPLAALGLGSLIVRDVSREQEQAPEILGSALAVSLIGASVAYGILLGVAFWVHSVGSVERIGIILAGIGLFAFAPSKVLAAWFTSRQQTAKTALATSTGSLVTAGVKVAFVVLGFPVVAFIAATTLEQALIGIVSTVVYLVSDRTIGRWSISRTRLRALGKEVLWLLGSGLFTVVFLEIDKLMLNWLASSQAVGTYTAAATISEVWYFFATAMVTSLLPVLAERQQQGQAQYLRTLQRSSDTLVGISVLGALATSLAAPVLIGMLYGPAYAAAAPILAVHVWAGPFVYLRTLFQQWLVLENLVQRTVVMSFAGAAVNIGLNLWLIPQYGGLGAAWATLISYAVAGYGAYLFQQSTRPAARIMTRSLLMPWRGLVALIGRRNG